MEAAAGYLNRINMLKTDYPYLQLIGQQALPDRSHIIALWNLPPEIS